MADWRDVLKGVGRTLFGGGGGGDGYGGGAPGPFINRATPGAPGVQVGNPAMGGSGGNPNIGRRLVGWAGDNPELVAYGLGTVASAVGAHQEGKREDRRARIDEEDRQRRIAEEQNIRDARQMAYQRYLARSGGA